MTLEKVMAKPKEALSSTSVTKSALPTGRNERGFVMRSSLTGAPWAISLTSEEEGRYVSTMTAGPVAKKTASCAVRGSAVTRSSNA